MKRISIKKLGLISLTTTAIIVITVTTLHFIPTGSHNDVHTGTGFVYLWDNGVHIDIVIKEENEYVAYGWGSKIFLTQVPSWDELTIKIGLQALFTQPESVIRVNRFKSESFVENLTPVRVTNYQMNSIRQSINDTFKTYKGERINIMGNLYAAHGNYWFGFTCNTWVNQILKKAGLRAPMYSLNSGAIIRQYE